MKSKELVATTHDSVLYEDSELDGRYTIVWELGKWGDLKRRK